uniref:Uncharacterized protein n=1 Tax=Glossina austeni TaxID=7395 RepID=A0A1A9ULS5_GLOAU
MAFIFAWKTPEWTGLAIRTTTLSPSVPKRQAAANRLLLLPFLNPLTPQKITPEYIEFMTKHFDVGSSAPPTTDTLYDSRSRVLNDVFASSSIAIDSNHAVPWCQSLRKPGMPSSYLTRTRSSQVSSYDLQHYFSSSHYKRHKKKKRVENC